MRMIRYPSKILDDKLTVLRAGNHESYRVPVYQPVVEGGYAMCGLHL